MNILKMFFDLIDEFIETVPFLSNYLVMSAASLLLCVLSVIIIYNGRSIMNSLKFLICAGVAFYGGYALLYPAVAAYLPAYLPAEYIGYAPLAIGCVLALVAALLSKRIYTLVLSAALGFVTYKAISMFLPTVAANPTYLIIIVAVVAILTLVFRSAVEMVGTSFGGAFLLVIGLNYLLRGMSAYFAGGEFGLGFGLGTDPIIFGLLSFADIFCIVVMLVFGLSGLIRQVEVKNRKYF